MAVIARTTVDLETPNSSAATRVETPGWRDTLAALSTGGRVRSSLSLPYLLALDLDPIMAVNAHRAYPEEMEVIRASYANTSSAPLPLHSWIFSVFIVF